MQMCRQSRPARQDKAAQRFDQLGHFINLRFKTRDLSVCHPQHGVGRFRILFHIGAAQVRAKIKQVVLDHGKLRVHLAGGMQAGHADRAICFVDRAIGRHARRMLSHTATVTKGGVPIITGPGVNFIQDNHDLNLLRHADRQTKGSARQPQPAPRSASA